VGKNILLCIAGLVCEWNVHLLSARSHDCCAWFNWIHSLDIYHSVNSK